MKISIITPCYNSRSTIEKSLLSVIHQTIQPLEHIVIDGGSTDGTLDIIENYRSQIDILISEKDEGMYEAINKGIKIASGDVIGILNSDDVYHTNRVIEKVILTFNKQATEAVYGDLLYMDERDKKIIRKWKAGGYKRTNFKNGWMPPHPTFFVKRGIYERYGDFDTAYNIAADYELMLRFLYKHQISVSYIPEVFVRMKIGGKSNRNLKSRIKIIKEDYLACKKNGIKLPVYTQIMKRLTKLHQYFLQKSYK